MFGSRRVLVAGVAAAALGAVVVSRTVGWRRLYASLACRGDALGSASAGLVTSPPATLGPRKLHLLVTTNGDVAGTGPLLTAARRSVDPTRVITSVRTLQQLEEEPWEAHALALVVLCVPPPGVEAGGQLVRSALLARVAAFLAGGGHVIVTGACAGWSLVPPGAAVLGPAWVGSPGVG